MSLRAGASVLLALAAISSIPEATSAETVVRLQMGDRVRVDAPTVDSKPMIGRIVYADPLQFTLVLDGEQSDSIRAVPWESLNLLERSEGHGSNIRKGALVGVGIGAGAGLVAGLAISIDSNDGGALFALPVLGGIVGLLGGVAVGAVVRSERWAPLPLNSRVGLQLGAPSTPFAVGIRTNF